MNLNVVGSGRALLRARLCAAGILAAGVAVFMPLGPGVVKPTEDVVVRDCRDETLQCSLDSVSVSRRVGFVIVSGVVRNGSGQVCHAIEVVADAEGHSGVVLDQESALIDTTDLYPGRTSSFSVILDDNQRIGSVSLRLRRLRSSPLTPRVRLTDIPGGMAGEWSGDQEPPFTAGDMR